MALYKYRAVNQDGEAVEGTIEEVSAQRVTAVLRERGLQVSSVEEVGVRPGFLTRKPRLTWEDLDLFNEQLLAITKTGLPLAPSLHALSQDIKNRRLRPILADIRRQIEAGTSLEEALDGHPESFSPVYRSIIRAGKRTGNLSGVLSHLSAYSARMVEMKNSFQEAIAYPILVLAASCFLLAFLMVKVVPVFAEMYGEFGGQLPAPTRFWINISSFCASHPITILICIVAGLAIVHYVLKQVFRTETGGYALDWMKLHIPVLGRVYSETSMSRFCRSLGLLLAGNVPVLEGLNLASSAAGNAVLRRAVGAASNLVAGGERISDALASTGFFGHSFCWLLGTGEGRGEVDRALLELADTYERRVARVDKMMLMLMGPLVIITLGVIVGFLVVSLYLPIFMLGDAVGGV